MIYMRALSRFFLLGLLLPLAAQAYENFDVAIYCTVRDVQEMADLERLARTVDLLQQHLTIDKVYLETHRQNFLIDDETLIMAKHFFEQRGIKTSGGITTTGNRAITGRFGLFCYTDKDTLAHFEKVVRFTARHFDEMILDDFYFTDCRCAACDEARGARSWAEFRTDLMRDVSRDIVLKAAREVNPDVKVIIKYPNWYDFYQYTGYNLRDQPGMFDMIYTGTETRDPVYHQQHLQPYQGYLIMRYLENIAPGRNGGGWVDPLDMRFLNRYAEQLSLTLFGGAREVTLFRFGSLLEWINPPGADPELLTINAPVAGYVFEKSDTFLGQLGKPAGLPVYKPVNSSGEAFLPNYLGMLGIPLELVPEFPVEANTVLLTESAAADPALLERMKQHLSRGKNLVITSGLLSRLQDSGLQDLIAATRTEKRFLANAFSDLNFTQLHRADGQVLLPIIEFPTNDAWMEVTAISGDNSYPVVLQGQYRDGLIHVLTIPDNFSDLYKIPAGTLTQIKDHLLPDLPVQLEAPAQVCLFLYDNNTCIVYSFLPHKTSVSLKFRGSSARVVDLLTGEVLETHGRAGSTEWQATLMPYSYRVLRWVD